MLTVDQATAIIHKNIPNGAVHRQSEYKNYYIFSVYYDDALEGAMDPYYKVDKKSGAFSELIIGQEITSLELARCFYKGEVE